MRVNLSRRRMEEGLIMKGGGVVRDFLKEGRGCGEYGFVRAGRIVDLMDDDGDWE